MNPQAADAFAEPRNIAIFGATGQTGQHFTAAALRRGSKVRALVRTPAKLSGSHLTGPGLDVYVGCVTDPPDLHRLLDGVDAVVVMLGDREAQRTADVNATFVKALVPAMRRVGVDRLLYQAGGLSAPPRHRLPPALWAIRHTLARSYAGQHHDNEAVMRYLSDNATDIKWVVHRAAIGSDGPSKGTLTRSAKAISIATFVDCAAYSHSLLLDPAAVHTCDPSRYRQSVRRLAAPRDDHGRA